VEFSNERLLGAGILAEPIKLQVAYEDLRIKWPTRIESTTGDISAERWKSLKVDQQLKISGWGYTAENGIDPNIKCTYSGVVITDVRFKNEMLFVHQWSGKVYWIDALKRVPLKDHFKHASEPGYETMSDCVDGVIDNNKDTACFKQQIQLLLNTSIRD
jgi:hypothetical protein